jgi:hypothetical protein
MVVAAAASLRSLVGDVALSYRVIRSRRQPATRGFQPTAQRLNGSTLN